MLVLLVSCATIHPTDSSVGNMSVEQARKVLTTDLKKRLKGSSIYDGQHNEIADVRVASNRLIVTDKNGKQSIFMYRKLPQVSLEQHSGNDIAAGEGTVKLADNATFFKMSTASANALYVLKQNAIKVKKASDEYDVSFAASLTDYRKKAASNAALPEEANKYKVQAEGAVRDKEFDDAADLYAAALKIAPWWPVGHFNRALVLGEIGDYEMAKREMKHYMQLVPNAPNARAAQDKIYEWERLETK